MPEFNQISTLKKIFDVTFIKESFYSFLPTKTSYSDLIAINNDNEFVSLSNGNIFVIPMLQTDKKTIEKIKDKLNHVFNREKYVVIFQKSEFEKEFDNIIYIDIDDLIEYSEKNGACKKNLFNLMLKGLILNDRTYAQQWLP